MSGGPLRLLYSGRLAPMKGADHLVRVASKLRSLHVPFELTICGDGPLEPQIRADITRLRLEDCVKLTGVIDFETELTPLTKHQADLFVCCHRQGDPSCTYVDVMSCGVAFVGYDNEALQGIVRHSAAGWMVPMDRTDRLAEKIAELSANCAEIVNAARKSLEFARKHSFEQTFRRRIEHLKACAAVDAWGPDK